MSRFLLVSRGTFGDINPFVAIGRMLRDRGHAVALAANDYFRDHVTRAGLEFVSHGSVDAYEGEQEANTALLLRSLGRLPLAKWPSTSSRRRIARFLAPEAKRTLEIIRRYAREDRDVTVGARGLVFAARVAQVEMGIRLATIYVSPFESMAMSWPGFGRGLSPRTERALYERVVGRIGDRLFALAYGVLLDDLFRTLGGHPRGLASGWAESPDLALALWPDWYVPRGPGWSAAVRTPGFVLFDGIDEALDRETADFLGARDDRVLVFTQGTFRRGDLPAFLDACAKICVASKRRGLVLADEPCCAASHRTILLVKRYVPLGALLTRAACLVHHGGMGTGARALHAGVRQLVVPVTGDQPWNARRLVSFGVAHSLRPADFHAGRGCEAIVSLLADDRVRAACAKWQALAAPDAALQEACNALEALARRRSAEGGRRPA